MSVIPPPKPLSKSEPTPAPPASEGLAVASLVLGIASLMGSVFVIGMVTAIPGLIFGVLHLQKKSAARGMAWWGIGLSTSGICASVALLSLYVYSAQQLMQNMSTNDPIQSWEGVIAPDMTITTLDGDTFQLSEVKGRRVIVDIWATWCPPCVAEIPHFNDLRDEFSEDELLIVAITDEDPQTVLDFLVDTPMNYIVAAFQDDLPEPYGAVNAFPTTFFIDRNGVIQTISVGYEDLDTLREYATAPDFEGEPLSEPIAPILLPQEEEAALDVALR